MVNERKSLKDLILEMEDEVLANAGVDVFEELFKLIFTKLYDEMESGRDKKRHLVFKNYGDTETELKAKIQDLFEKAQKKWEGVFPDGARTELTPSHLAVCVASLETVKLFNSNLEVVDDAFEYLINKSSKGEKGQYFTPRYVIDLCVKMMNPQEHETLVDTAAGILAALDSTIGTNYRSQYADHRRWPIEKLAIEVGIILVQHAVGVLIIEEIQARNFSMSPNREEMLLFILRVLNFGVPVVLVGNPLGFVGLDEFSQDINRLTENEPIHLMPAEIADKEWTEGLGPGMWSHNVMPRHTRWSAAIGSELHACSAGFPGYVRKATDGAQLIAMGEGAQAVDLSHLKRYREKSRTFSMNRGLIEGFAEKDPLKLMKYLDVPWEQYGQDWGKLSLADIAEASSDATESTDPRLWASELLLTNSGDRTVISRVLSSLLPDTLPLANVAGPEVAYASS